MFMWNFFIVRTAQGSLKLKKYIYSAIIMNYEMSFKIAVVEWVNTEITETEIVVFSVRSTIVTHSLLK